MGAWPILTIQTGGGPRSSTRSTSARFADSDGDGVGDLPGITSRLPHLRDLGVDGLWITPFYTSPQNDHGYDVADYCDVDPRFGTLDDADALIATRPRARPEGRLRHRAQPHLERARVVQGGAGRRARQPRARALPVPHRQGRDGAEPPNNWDSVFGGPAWDGSRAPTSGTSTSSTPPSPTSTGATPRSPAMFEDVLRFWLDRGVDGFRVDVAHSLYKEAVLRDQVKEPGDDGKRAVRRAGEGGMVEWKLEGRADVGPARGPRRLPRLAQDPRLLRARAGCRSPRPGPRPRSPRRATSAPTSCTRPSTSPGCSRPGRPRRSRRSSRHARRRRAWSSSSPTWVLSNHDVTRHMTRYGGGRSAWPGRARPR